MSNKSSVSVFLSYSHDSLAHKDWVRRLAEKLRAGGVDAILDQWDLRPGADIVKFMEEGIRLSDRVLLVCSANYVAKSEERKGGVGYEGIIVTGHVARNIDTVKFVPLVRDNVGPKLVPDFLGPRLWIDFRDDSAIDDRIDDLLRELHQIPRHPKPPLGQAPFTAESTHRGSGSRHTTSNIEDLISRLNVEPGSATRNILLGRLRKRMKNRKWSREQVWQFFSSKGMPSSKVECNRLIDESIERGMLGEEEGLIFFKH